MTAIKPETKTVKTLTLALPEWTPHRPGQHYDVRLTAADGYSTQRSYSIASEPERVGEIDITVERIPDGEVSAFLDDVVKVTIFLVDLAHFALVNKVMAEYFREPYPARAAVGVAALPRGALVEADAILVFLS